MDFKLTREAELDLTKIWNYTRETWSIEQADRYINLIIEEIEYICKKPESGIDFSSVREGYYKSKVKSHFIFYRINALQKNIEIIRILHQRMDINRRLN
jgi:toxin ParE1/3/4